MTLYIEMTQLEKTMKLMLEQTKPWFQLENLWK